MLLKFSLDVKTVPMPNSNSVHSFAGEFLWPGSTYCWQIKVFCTGIKSGTGYVGHWRIHHPILSYNDNCYEKLAHSSIFQCNIFMQRYKAIKLGWNLITVISKISANKQTTQNCIPHPIPPQFCIHSFGKSFHWSRALCPVFQWVLQTLCQTHFICLHCFQ